MRQPMALFSAAFLLLLVAAASGQDKGGERFRLAEAKYVKSGFVQDFALASLLDIEIGKVFDSRAALERFVWEADHTIRSNRIFEAGSGVVWEAAGDPDASGLEPVRIVVRARLSGTALALPYPKYSSSTGLTLAVRYKDYNFLGTLQPITLSMDAYSRGGADVGVDFSLPVSRGNSTYTWDLDGSLSYDGSALTLDGSTGLSADIPLEGLGPGWELLPQASYSYSKDTKTQELSGGAGIKRSFEWPFAWSLSYSETGTWQENGSSSAWLSHSLSAATSLYAFDAGFLGPVTFSAATGPTVETEIPGLGLRDIFWSFSPLIAADRVEWVGNLRRGSAASLGSTTTWYLDDSGTSARSQVSLDFVGTWFRPVSDILGLNIKVESHWFPAWALDGYASDFAWEDLFRGYSKALRGDAGMAVSLESPIDFAQGRFFDVALLSAEVFLDPFLDIGFVRQDPKASLLASGQGIACGGLEAIVYPDKARAFAYRLSAGYDLGDLVATKSFSMSRLELWLGLGLFF